MRAWIGAGTNLGDRDATLRSARESLHGLAATEVTASSSVYESPAWGLSGQPDFLNQVIQVRTSLEPAALLDALQAVERAHGRIRDELWGPRTLDLDILLLDEPAVVEDPRLVVPHRHIAERRFVLVPLAELAAERVVPGTDRTVADLLQACNDKGHVRPFGPR